MSGFEEIDRQPTALADDAPDGLTYRECDELERQIPEILRAPWPRPDVAGETDGESLERLRSNLERIASVMSEPDSPVWRADDLIAAKVRAFEALPGAVRAWMGYPDMAATREWFYGQREARTAWLESQNPVVLQMRPGELQPWLNTLSGVELQLGRSLVGLVRLERWALLGDLATALEHYADLDR